MVRLDQSSDQLVKNAAKRDALRDQFNPIRTGRVCKAIPRTMLPGSGPDTDLEDSIRLE